MLLWECFGIYPLLVCWSSVANMSVDFLLWHVLPCSLLHSVTFRELVETPVSFRHVLPLTRQQQHGPRRWPVTARGGVWTTAARCLQRGARRREVVKHPPPVKEEERLKSPEFPLQLNCFAWLAFLWVLNFRHFARYVKVCISCESPMETVDVSWDG